MPDLVRDYLRLPDQAALQSFIIKDGSDPDELARTYVFTEKVAFRLGKFLDDVGRLLERRQNFQSLGRWVYGSFGSGKSHFLRIVEMMLARDQRLYALNDDPKLLELQGAHPFLVRAKILTVRVTMMGRTEGSLTARLARAFDARLEALGLAPAGIFDYDRTFSAFDRFCSRGAGILDEFLVEHDYDRALFESRRAGTVEERRALAQECARFMFGDDGPNFEPAAADAREQMARHAVALGFEAVAFLIDEFVLWAQSLPGEQYIQAVNELTGLVDSERQPIPFIVLAAIQRSITERFNDDRSEDSLRQQLAHTRARFDPQIVLEDRDLFEVTRRRVLAVREGKEAAWALAVTEALRPNAAARSVLVGSDAPETLAQLYPFHPALLHVLSDVTQGLQRERTSLYMLFQLLVEIRPNLEVGQIVSLGALWEALYSDENLHLLHDQVRMRGTNDASHKLVATYETWDRLRESIAEAAKQDDERRVLDLVAKSILLCQLSQTRFFADERPLSDSITIENLFRLNRAEIDVPIEALGARKIADLLERLAGVAPSFVRLAGKAPSDKVAIDLDTVDIRGMLDGLRASANDRFAVLLRSVKSTLDASSYVRDLQLDGLLSVQWRNTTRKGRVKFERLELLVARGHDNDFAPEASEAFRVLVLLDVDDPAAAAERVALARAYAQQWTAVIVAGVLSAAGREALELLAKLEVFERDPDAALKAFRMSEHATVRRQIAANRSVAESRLRDALVQAYGRDAQLLTLQTNAPEILATAQRDPAALVSLIAQHLLDLRYPQHPKFVEVPRRANLDALLVIVARAIGDANRAALTPEEALRVERLGVPLELFDQGQLVATLRQGGTYVRSLRTWIDEGETTVVSLRKRFDETFGITSDVAGALIVAFALQSDYRLAVDGHERVALGLGDIDVRGRLVQGRLPSETAWIAGRTAAVALFGLTDAPPQRTAANVAVLATAIHGRLDTAITAIAQARDALRLLLIGDGFPGTSRALEVYRDAGARLAALPRDEVLFERLAELSAAEVTRLKQAITAADGDAAAVRDLSSRNAYRSVQAALLAELARTLEHLEPPLAPQLAAWRSKADTWIEETLKRGAERPTADDGALAFQSDVGAVQPTLEAFTIASEAELESGFNEVRAAVRDALRRGIVRVTISTELTESRQRP